MSKKENELKNQIEAVKRFIYNDEIQNTLSNINNNVMDFNILEITGMGHYEIRHSNILGWLFDDSEHNLEYELLENFLKKVIEANENTDNSEFNILDRLQSYIYLAENKKNITVYREKDNIDLLIVDDANKVIITIENKIFATERTTGKTDDGQLSKYEDIVNNKFISKSQDKKNGYEKYFIFLTLNLDEPIKGKEYWMIANHQMIADVIENTLSTKQDLSVKTKLVLESYIDLLKRRGIVESNELEQLTNKIWGNPKYKDALEILYQYKPDIQSTISNYLQDVLKGTASEELKKISNYVNCEASSKSYIRFTDKKFDDFEEQNKGEGWNNNINKILVYEFNNLANNLSLDLIVGPGDANSRENFFNVPLEHKDAKKSTKFDKNKKSWSRIFKTNIKLEIDGFDEDEIKKELDKFLLDFFREDGDFFKIQQQIINALNE